MARGAARGATAATCTRPVPRSVPVPAPAASSACCRAWAETPRRKPTLSLPGITADACGTGATAACRTPAVARPPEPDTTTASTATEAARRRPRALLPRYWCNVGVTILTWGSYARSVEAGDHRVLQSGDGGRTRAAAHWRLDEAPGSTLRRRSGNGRRGCT